ncbi:hypothetical protein EJB05_53710, partial [Eragrostis curvula]
MGNRRHKGKAAAKNKRRCDPPCRPTSVHDLPDDLLGRVILHVGSLVNLVRAAAVCRRWRRAIADAGFLARFRSVNGAARVAGHYYVPETQPPYPTNRPPPRRRQPEKKPTVFVPAAPSGAAVDDTGLFSLDFLPVTPLVVDGRRWRPEIVDSRGSLLLLNCQPWPISDYTRLQRSPDLIVCEPATRRFQGIPRPPDFSRLYFLGAFLLPGGDAMSTFRVLYVLYQYNASSYSSGTARVFLFGPGTESGWRLCWHTEDDDVKLPCVEKFSFAGRAAGRVCWGIETGQALVLDESTLDFSLVPFPDHVLWPGQKTSFRVIGGLDEDDDHATVRVVRVGGQSLDVFYQMPGSSEWVVESSVQLRDAAAGLPGWDDKLLKEPARIVAAGDTFVVLTPAEETWLFSVDLETMFLEREHERNRHVGQAYPCSLPWPPVLQACLDRDGVVGKRR